MSRGCSVCGGPFHGRKSVGPDGLFAHGICLGRKPGRRRETKSSPRSWTTPTKHLTRELLRSHAALLEPEDFAALADRPKTWGECCESTGPCPWVSCKHHLYLDVNPLTGSIKINYPDLEPEELEQPCALRIAATGGVTLEEVGVRMNLTRERVRQVEVRALHKLAGEMGDA